MKEINKYKSIHDKLKSLMEHSKIMRDRVMHTICNSQYCVEDFVEVIDSLDVIDKELKHIECIETMRLSAAVAFQEED